MKWLGDKKFYRTVLILAVPIMIQTGVTNFVNLLDNVMVGRLGTEQMSAVSIANQLILIFNIAIFGVVSGAGIYGAQFFGKGDAEGTRYCFRFKLLLSFMFSLMAMIVFYEGREVLIGLYLKEGGEAVGSLANTGLLSQRYLMVMLAGLIPFALSQCYGTSLKEFGETVIPMIASAIAVGVNLVGNFVLIFGYLGFPALGVIGAAIATVISRFVELAILMFYAHRRSEVYYFAQNMRRQWRIPRELLGKIVRTSVPLIVNETMWSASLAFLLRNYAQRGLMVVAAYNIMNTAQNVFFLCFSGFGTAISIILGQKLGAGEIEQARKDVWKLVGCSMVTNCFVGLLLFAVSTYIPLIYNTEPSVRKLATELMRVLALFFPIQAGTHACYFTIRSGGRTFITFLFDSGFMWAVSLPLSFVLIQFTKLPILTVYTAVLSVDIIKIGIGFGMIRSGIWAKKLVV